LEEGTRSLSDSGGSPFIRTYFFPLPAGFLSKKEKRNVSGFAGSTIILTSEIVNFYIKTY